MSYGNARGQEYQDRLSACHAEFLSVHPYFDPNIPDEETPGPTIELISPNEYPTGSTSISIQLKVSDPEGLHQVFLFVDSRGGFAGGTPEVKACLGLSGEKDTVVEFDYDGVVPSEVHWYTISDKRISNLSDPLVHQIRVEAVDSFGNVGAGGFSLFDTSTQGNLIATLYEPSGPLSVSFSPDGTTLASGSWDGVIRLWDVAMGINIATLEGHTDRVLSVSFSPDSKILASGSRDDTVKLYDVATQTTIATLEEHTADVNSVSFSPDGTMLASGGGISWRGDLPSLLLWDISTGQNIATLEGHTASVNSVAFSPDGSRLASGSRDGTVKLWDVATRQNTVTLKHRGSNAFVNSVAFSPDGTMLASGAWDGVIQLWDMATRDNIANLIAAGYVNSVAFSPDGATLASGSGSNAIEFWDVVTMSKFATLVGHTDEVLSVSFSPDDKILASGSYDGTILLWDMSEWLQPRPSANSDFDGDGTVGFPDFLLFVEQFGFSREDEAYQARYDLDGDGIIGFGDFLIFVNAFGKTAS